MNGRIYLSLMAKHMNGRIYLALMVLLTFVYGENDRVLPVCLNTDGRGEEFHFIVGLHRLQLIYRIKAQKSQKY
jgi:hypothetical protein